MKFITAMLRHETNTFSSIPTPISAFDPVSGDTALSNYKGTNTPIAAFIDIAQEQEAELIIPIVANATPSSCPEDNLIDYAEEKIISAVKDGCNAIFLDLHGGMVTKGYDESRRRTPFSHP